MQANEGMGLGTHPGYCRTWITGVTWHSSLIRTSLLAANTSDRQLKIIHFISVLESTDGRHARGWADSCGPNETLMSWEASLIFCICPEIVGSVIKRFAISFSVGPMMADPVARNMEFLFPGHECDKRNGLELVVGWMYSEWFNQNWFNQQ